MLNSKESLRFAQGFRLLGPAVAADLCRVPLLLESGIFGWITDRYHVERHDAAGKPQHVADGTHAILGGIHARPDSLPSPTAWAASSKFSEAAAASCTHHPALVAPCDSVSTPHTTTAIGAAAALCA